MEQQIRPNILIEIKPTFLQETALEINGKTVRMPFQVSMPRSSSEFQIVCEILEPNFIAKEMLEYDGKEFVSAMAYKINEYNRIRREYLKNIGQKTLSSERLAYSMLTYLDKIKIKIIDPNTEFLRIGNRKSYRDFLKLKAPDYFMTYLENRRNAKSKNNLTELLEDLHFKFWDSLFLESDVKGKILAPHLIDWFKEKEMKEMGADIFLPPVPFVKNNKTKDRFIRFSKQINEISYDFYGEKSAFYLIFDAELFKNAEAIENIANMIAESKNKFIIFKILGIKKITELGFGDHSKKNFEYFLKVINDVKSINPDKVIGFLDGGGFGYCLIGTGIDFFTDTVSNYPQDHFARYTTKHRALLHPKTLTPEPIEGVIQHQKQYGCLFHDNTVADKYKGVDILSVERDQWSVDAKKMGLIMWQKRMASLMNTDKLGWSRMRFDEILNSDFSSLGVIVKRIMNSE